MNVRKSPTFSQALICFGGMMTMIIIGVLVFGVNMHILLLASIIWVSFNAYFLGYKFPEIKDIMNGGVAKGIGACYIFILVGIVIAAFIESGTITSLVYYGLDIINPTVFLPAGLLLCAFMSLAVGSQFGTVATAGVILIGVGSAFGIPLPIIAGMVVSGASFGDKMSPVSDTTNLAAVAAETDLYKHIKSMLYTTLPTFIICIVLFTIIGLEYSSGSFSDGEILAFQSAIDANFNVNFISFLPIVVLLALSLNKVAAEPAMLASAGVAMILAMIQQERSMLDILASFQDGYSADTGFTPLDVLVNRGGVQSMMWTFSLALFALILGGLLEKIGILSVLLKGVLMRAKTAFSLMLATICSGVVSCLSTGDSYFGTIVTSQVFKKKYEEMKLQKYLLSRCVEESTTLSTPIIPWALGGAFVAGTLGVPVLDYLPYAFLNYLNMFVSLGLAYFGFGIFRIKDGQVEPAPDE
ncbi:MAG: Na+/H+ antiporter NhaC [Emcibacteraceae bacterium]|nr:Na+/H+ antiporter NhaC [Emcibacteraceae bacterium]